MTDLERFAELLRDFKIPYRMLATERAGFRRETPNGPRLAAPNPGTTIVVDSSGYWADTMPGGVPGDNARVDGYGEFHSSWDFDAEGRFLLVGHWE